MLQIIGRGGFAREVAAYTAAETVMRLSNEDLNDLPTVIAIGDSQDRARIATELPYLEYTKVQAQALVHPSSKIGEGSIICPYSVVTVDCIIGKHLQLNLGVTVGHDCKIGDFFTAAPKASISGNVTIGDRCYLGSNAVIKQGVTICDDVTIGAGCIVTKDITEAGTYVGIPAKKI